jgi:hypothetical protein
LATVLNTDAFRVGSNKVRHFVKALDIAMLPAWHVCNLSSPRGSFRIVNRIFDPDFDDERMQLRLA